MDGAAVCVLRFDQAWNLYALLSALYRQSWSFIRALEYGGSYPLFSAGPVKRLTKIILVGIITYFLNLKILYITTYLDGFHPFSFLERDEYRGICTGSSLLSLYFPFYFCLVLPAPGQRNTYFFSTRLVTVLFSVS